MFFKIPGAGAAPKHAGSKTLVRMFFNSSKVMLFKEVWWSSGQCPCLETDLRSQVRISARAVITKKKCSGETEILHELFHDTMRKLKIMNHFA